MMSRNAGSLRWLQREYHDINGSFISILPSPPSPVEFAQAIHIGRPVVIKGLSIPATASRWTDSYLVEKMGDRLISVAVTPDGAADAIALGPDGQPYFTEPCVENMTMRSLLDKLCNNKRSSKVHYLQSQNGNVYMAQYFQGDRSQPSEFESLREDIPSEVTWCSEALGRCPDAVNLWIGDGRSVTSIHSDPYENIYTVVRGEKYFTLLAPVDSWCMNERMYPHAQYFETTTNHELSIVPSPDSKVRWSSIKDPRIPGSLPAEAKPFYISLCEGDTLYLPAGWWHHVAQAQDTLTIALNYWYDTDMQGSSWVLMRFLRGLDVAVPDGQSEKPAE